MKKFRILLAVIAVFAVCCCSAVFAACDEEEHVHNWGEWEVTTPATCEDGGEETRVCADDPDHKETRKTDPTGHSFGEWEEDTPATCKAKKVEKRECACGEEETRDVGELAAHTPVKTNAKAATCSEAGYEEYWTCSVCEKKFSDEACTDEITAPVPVNIDPTAHKWSEWEELTPATCTDKKVEERVCEHNAGHTETREVGEPLGHGTYKYLAKADGDKYKVVFACPACGDEDATKTAYECDTALIADGKNTYASGNDKSYPLNLTKDTTYFVDSSNGLTSSSGLTALSFVPETTGEYVFTFTHLTDKVTALATAYCDGKTMTNRTGAALADYSEILSITRVGAGNTNVINAVFNVPSGYVGSKFVLLIMTSGATADNPTPFLIGCTVPEIQTVAYGANKINITKENATYETSVDSYLFVPDKTQKYSVTVPAGVSVLIDGKSVITDNGEAAYANFNAAAGQNMRFVFVGANVAEYTAVIGEAIYPKITPDTPYKNLNVPAKDVTVLEVGAVEAGTYKLEITVSSGLMRSVFYFGKNINADYEEIYGPADKFGMGGTAEVIFQNMNAKTYNGATYDVKTSGTKITVELELKEGDTLVFAHSNTVDGTIDVTMTAVV